MIACAFSSVSTCIWRACTCSAMVGASWPIASCSLSLKSMVSKMLRKSASEKPTSSFNVSKVVAYISWNRSSVMGVAVGVGVKIRVVVIMGVGVGVGGFLS